MCVCVRAILDNDAKEGVSRNMTFDQGPQGWKETKFAGTSAKSSVFKGSKVRASLAYSQKVRRSLRLDPSK